MTVLVATTSELAAKAERWLRVAAVLLAFLVFGSWLLIAVARIDDSYGTVGPWTGLAFDAAHGNLYPPLFDGESFGGTRYMPLQFLCYAGASKLTGEFFISAKLVVGLVAVALLALVYFVLTNVGCRRWEAFAVTAAVTTTAPVLLATTAVGGDSIAVLAQLAALTIVARRGAARAGALAGALCGLAFLSKLSAVWAPVAIAIWLARRPRRTLLIFLASYAATALLGVLAIYLASDGRVFDNLFLLSSGSRSLKTLAFDTPREFVTLFRDSSEAAWLLVPVAAAGLVLAIAHRQVTLYQISTLAAVVITFVVLTDEGAYWNHLVDVSVLLPIIAAESVARTSRYSDLARTLSTSLLLAAVVFGIATGYDDNFRLHLRGSLRGLAFGVADPGFPRPPLKGLVGADDAVLSEDASIAVARDRRPVVLDPYMLLRILKRHPDWERTLVGRIDARRFDKVVLLRELDPESRWYTHAHFGHAVASAIARNYRFQQMVPGFGYWIYVPRREER